MKQPTKWVLRLYALLLALHPRRFRNEFGEEMRAVFGEALSDVHQQGWLSLLIWCGQEFSSLIRLLVRERWLSLRRERAVMKQSLNVNQVDDFDEIEVRTAVSWVEISAGILPFLLLGSIYVIKGLDYHFPPSRSWAFTRQWQLVTLLLLLVGLGIGWARSFPRWSYAYLGAAFVSSSGMASSVTYGFALFGYTFGAEQWGWRGWAPILLLIVLMLLLTRSLRPLARMLEGMKRDWTLLSFTLYAMMSWLNLGMNYDNKSWYDQTLYLPLGLLLVTLLFAGGAYLYMIAHRQWPRALALQAAFILSLPTSAAITTLDGGFSQFASPSTVVSWLSYHLFLLLWCSVPLFPGLAVGTWRRVRPA